MRTHLIVPGSTWYGMRHSSGELISLKGAVIVHDNPYEYEFIVTGTLGVVALSGRTPQEVATRLQRRVMLLKEHPDLSWVRWPLDRNDFWDPQRREFSANEMVAVRRLQWLS